MHLHRLELSAIGPFADTFVVDFDALGASGLFLLEGPTGAGKSTLIDAVVFALYGQVAGAESSSDRLHSDVAPPERTPYVELDFSTARGLYRVRRTPKHERAKRRGEGTVTENATAHLWRLLEPPAAAGEASASEMTGSGASARETSGSEVGEPVTTRVDDVGREISEALGLSREQFTQTVVLPQGEFAAFLRSDPEGRRRLLQRLFGTEIYERVLARLEELRKQAKQQRADADAAVSGAVRAFAGAAGLDGDDQSALDACVADDEALSAAVADRLQGLRDQCDVARRSQAEADGAAEQAHAEHARRKARHDARLRLIDLTTQQRALEARQPQLDAAALRLRRADLAAPLLPLLDGLAAAEGRAAAAETVLASRTRALGDDGLDCAEPAGWPDLERSLRDEVSRLEQLGEREVALPGRVADLAALRAQLDDVRRRHRRVDEAIVLAPRELEQLRQRLHDAEVRRSSLAAAPSELAAATAAVAEAERLAGLLDRHAAKGVALESARQQAQHQADLERELRRHFLDGQAGYLARDLVDGQPCPVCGSPTHPQPAPRPTSDVDRAALEAAEASMVAAERVLTDARGEVDALSEQVEQARRQGAAESVAAVQARVRDAELDVAALQVAGDDVERLEVQLRAAQDELDGHRATLDQVKAEAARLDVQVAALAEAVEGDERAVDEARAGHASVADRIASATRQADLLAESVRAAQEVHAAASDVRTREQQWQAELAAAPFAGRSDVVAARLDDEQRGQIADELAHAARRRTELAVALADPGLADARGDLEASDALAVAMADPELAVADSAHELAVAAEALVAAQSAQRQAQQALTGLTQRASDTEQRESGITETLVERRRVHEASAPVIRMANLAAGTTSDNAKAMSLPAFVLRERFVEVVASANERLATMSDGRYALEHVEQRERGRRAGLGLRVRDTHTDQPRDPRTLSGGETFYCSLALALGLADVVTAEAGGVDLGTLFVDEGFGSLDADTLDQVLEVLASLSASGRVVGVVSHVPEMKERISERVSIQKHRDGSSRLVVSA